jgi:uncharacterized protein YkwD
MRRSLILALLALIACSTLASGASVAAQATPQGAGTLIFLPLVVGPPSLQTAEQQAMADEVLALINAERAAAGCGPVSADRKLTAAAQGHSEDMAANNFFSHSGSNGSSFITRITAAAYPYAAAGENIAAGYSSAKAVVTAWMESDGHRDNILNCNYVHTGLGYVAQPGTRYVHYWTQVFAAPR